jgi:S-adenosylmethionine hydrolase
MPDPLITLTTDFGTESPFVAAVKGVILGINPSARLIDLSHAIPPFDLAHAAFFLAESLPYFPPAALHVVVVDPGVGSGRAILYVEAAGQRLLAPDNGCWALFARRAAGRPRVVRLAEPRFWRPVVSATFHGRDIFAPAAAHLSLGLDPAALGPPAPSWEELPWPEPVEQGGGVTGEVVFVDHFGNLLTNIPAAALDALGPGARVSLAGGTSPRRVRTYADAGPGELVALVSSSGLLEVAVVRGSAAGRLGVGVGAAVRAGAP